MRTERRQPAGTREELDVDLVPGVDRSALTVTEVADGNASFDIQVADEVN